MQLVSQTGEGTHTPLHRLRDRTVVAEVMKFAPTATQLKSVTTFDDALALARETYGEAAVRLASEAIGDGFAPLENKGRLVGVPLLFLSWNEVSGDDARSIGANGYIVARVVTKDNSKYVVTDGSLGLNMQLREYSADTGIMGGLVVERGLRESTYDYTDESTGKVSKATTFYLDTAATA